MSSNVDVLVVGAGPAGCASARLLASWGRRVRLIAGDGRRGAAPRALAESLPPSTGRLFDALGVSPAIDAAGFVRSTGNTVWWGSETPRVEGFGEGRLGWQVTADRLEAVLQAQAEAAGVRIERRAIAAAEARRIDARFRLDCTGRAGVLARTLDVRIEEPRLRSVALVGAWRVRAPVGIPDDTHTLIESYADGWGWSVPVADGVRHIAVMVDPRVSNLTAHAPPKAIYLAEIAKTRRFRALIAGEAALEEGPRGWDASMYRSTRAVDGDTLLVGDAASFVDPLSSAGVRKALISAWAAAVAVHTALADPGRRAMALAWFDAREADLYAALRGLTVAHLAGAARGHGDPFWEDRLVESGFSRTPSGRTVGASGFLGRRSLGEGGSRTAAVDDERIAAAYEDLRRRDRLSLQLVPAARIEPRPIVEGRELVARPHLVVEGDPAPVRYLHDVEIPALVEIAVRETDAGAMFDDYCRRRGSVPLPQFLTALATLLARGWLCYNNRIERS